MELQPIQGRRIVDPGGRAPCTSPRDVAQGLQRLQRAVSRGSADLHRYAFAGTVPRRAAMGGLPAILPIFLAPLALMSLTDIRLGQLCRTNLDGVPLDLATRLLPWRSRVRFGLLLHLHLHGLVQYPEVQTREAGSPGRFSQSAMLGLIESLESTVKGLSWKPGRSTWVAYSKESTYSPDQTDRKSRFIAEFLELVRPASVWDLGANTGNFSRLSSDRGIPTAAFDFDPACVEVNYREVKKRHETKLLPLLVDLLNPSPACGWVNRERISIFQRGRPKMVLALALIHHLAITGNLPLEHIAEFFSDLAPWLAIEF